MNLTDKELKSLKKSVENVLEEVSKFVPYEDKQRPLNNRKYTVSYRTYPNELYVEIYCKSNIAYYFSVEDNGGSYKLTGRSYRNNKPDTSNMFTMYLAKNYSGLHRSNLDAIANSVSSKERLKNLCTVLDLVVLTNDMVKWESQG